MTDANQFLTEAQILCEQAEAATEDPSTEVIAELAREILDRDTEPDQDILVCPDCHQHLDYQRTQNIKAGTARYYECPNEHKVRLVHPDSDK